MLNDRCPTCHKDLKGKETKSRKDHGVFVRYCMDCYDTFFGKDEK